MTGPKGFPVSKRTSFVDEGDKLIPGPGKYNSTFKNLTKNPEYPIGESERRNSFLQQFTAKYPSPQQYKIDYKAIEKQPLKFSIPHSEPKEAIYQGVYAYHDGNLNKIRKKSPQYSLGYYYKPNYENGKPGPANYQQKYTTTSQSFFNTRENFMTKSSRTKIDEGSKIPGPGNYKIRDFFQSTKYSFSKGLRSPVSRFEDPPAIFYDISKKTKKMLSNTMGSSKKQSFKISDVPGPNAYKPQKQKKIHNTIVLTSNRSQIENISQKNSPSPQKYSHTQTMLNQQKAQSIGNQKRKPIIHKSLKQIPGVGKYQVASKFTTQGGALSKKSQQQVVLQPQERPSMITYNPKFESIQAKIQTSVQFYSQRKDFSKSVTAGIGPGSYNLQKDLSKQLGAIGKSPRKKQALNRNPGPGCYDVPTYFGKLPKYYCSPKKINQQGFSIYSQKMKKKSVIKEKLLKDLEKAKQTNKEHINPQIN